MPTLKPRSFFLALLALEPLDLLEEEVRGEYRVHAVVVVLVVVVLVCDGVDALELVGVARRHNDFIGVALAVALDPHQLPHAAEQDLVEDDGVVAAVVKLRHFCVLHEPNAEELIHGAAVLPVLAGELVRGADKEDAVAPGAHFVARVALAAAPVLGPDHGLLVLLHDAAELVRVVLVLLGERYIGALELHGLHELVHGGGEKAFLVAWEL